MPKISSKSLSAHPPSSSLSLSLSPPSPYLGPGPRHPFHSARDAVYTARGFPPLYRVSTCLSAQLWRKHHEYEVIRHKSGQINVRQCKKLLTATQPQLSKIHPFHTSRTLHPLVRRLGPCRPGSSQARDSALWKASLGGTVAEA